MDRDIQIAVTNGIIRVTYKGNVEYDPTTQMLKTVGRLAEQKKIDRLLFDVREANYQDYYVGTIRHAEEGADLGIQRSFRIAFLGAPTSTMLGYIEAVSVNRGYWVQTFTQEDEALTWLHGNA
jgi:hypothetical protein